MQYNYNKVLYLLIFVMAIMVVSMMATSEFALTKQAKAPTDVVKQYLFASINAQYEKISPMVARYPYPPLDKKVESREESTKQHELIRTESRRHIISSDKEVSPVIDAYDVFLEWTGKDFPKMVFDNKLVVNSIEGEWISNEKAKVSVLMGNENSFKSLPWTFLLIQTQEGWKIFDIVTAEEAKFF